MTNQKSKVPATKIVSAVVQFYKVSFKKLQKRSRKFKLVKPRQIAMYLLREELNKSYSSIVRVFKMRDHTLAMYAHEKVDKLIQSSPEFRAEIDEIKNLIYNTPLSKIPTQVTMQNDKAVRLRDDHEDPMEKRLDVKGERFKRLAVYRTNEVLKRLKVLGNCANRSAYSYREDEINKIFFEIERQVKEVKAKFHFPKKRE